MQTYDYIILGGGVIGFATACELKKAGASVALIEMVKPGAGASRAAAGMLTPHAGPLLACPFHKLLKASHALYADFVRELEETTGIHTEYRTTGLIYLCHNEAEEKSLVQRARWQKNAGVKTRWIDTCELHEREPRVSSSVEKGLLFEEDAQIDNRKLMDALVKRAELLGVEVIIGAEKPAVWIENNKVCGSVVGKSRYSAPVVVHAEGAWAALDESLPFQIPVKPSKGQILVFQSKRPLFNHIIHSGKAYLVTRQDGRLIVGATVESVGFDTTVTIKGLDKLVRGVLSVNRDFASLPLVEAWAGLRPRTRDSLPILGECEVEGLILANGHYRHGILLTPVTAKAISRLALGQDPEYDIAPFRLSRFQRGVVSTK